MTKKRILSFITAAIMCSAFTLPAYAEETEPAMPSVDIVETEDDTSDMTDNNTKYTYSDCEEEYDNADIPEHTETADNNSKYETQNTDNTELVEDHAEYGDTNWFSFDRSSGTLTLRGQLPDTKEEFLSAYDLAYYTGIDHYDVKKIVITEGTKAGTSTNGMFYNMGKLTAIEGIDNLNTSNVTDMKYMFEGCTALTSLDLSSFDTSNVTSMRMMFDRCPALTSLDLSSFDTSNVTDMYAMFWKCSALTTITVSDKWSITAVTDSSDMFFDCTSLKGGAGTVYDSSKTDKTYAHVDGGTWFPGYFTTSGHFEEATGITLNKTALTLSMWSSETLTAIITPSDTTIKDVFWTSDNQNVAIVTNGTVTTKAVGTAKITAKTYNGLTAECTLTVTPPDWCEWDSTNGTLTLKGQLPNNYYDTYFGKVYNIARISGIDSLEVKKIIITSGTTAGTSTYGMFYGLTNLTVIDGLDNIDTSNVTDMRYMFDGCTALTSLDLSSFDTSNVTTMKNMFCRCTALISLDLSSFDTSNVTNMEGMFCRCTALTSLDLSSFDTLNITNMDCMFDGCTALTSLDLSCFNTLHVMNMRYMFYECFALKNIIVSDKWRTATNTQSDKMFDGCTSLKGGAGTVYDSSKTNKTYAHIDGGASDPGYLTGNIAARGIALNNTAFAFERGKSRTITATVQPVNATDKTVTWTSSNDAIATVSNGTITGVSAGTATITASTSNGITATCVVTVNPEKPTVAIKTAFGGKTVQFNCIDPDAEIYYQTASSNITLSSKHVKPGTTVFFNTPMTGSSAAIYFKSYKNGKWSTVGKWGLLNVKIEKPIIKQSGPKRDNNFLVYTQTKNSYIVYTLDGSTPAIKEGIQERKVINGSFVWGTSTIINIPTGSTIKAIAIRNGLVTSDVMTYTNK